MERSEKPFRVTHVCVKVAAQLTGSVIFAHRLLTLAAIAYIVILSNGARLASSAKWKGGYYHDILEFKTSFSPLDTRGDLNLSANKC